MAQRLINFINSNDFGPLDLFRKIIRHKKDRRLQLQVVCTWNVYVESIDSLSYE